MQNDNNCRSKTPKFQEVSLDMDCTSPLPPGMKATILLILLGIQRWVQLASLSTFDAENKGEIAWHRCYGSSTGGMLSQKTQIWGGSRIF